MSDAADLYDTDFARGAETQARVLRDAAEAGVNVPVDWVNVAEEIESLARADRRTIRSQFETIIEHLLKLQFSPSPGPRRGWQETVRKARHAAEDLLDESPSLRRDVPTMIEAVRRRALKEAVDRFRAFGEDQAAKAAEGFGGRYEDEQVTGDWFPPDPSST